MLVLFSTGLAWITAMSIIALVPIDVWATMSQQDVPQIGTLWDLSYWCSPSVISLSAPSAPPSLKLLNACSDLLGAPPPLYVPLIPWLESTLSCLCMAYCL